ncbi:hypothetical protein CYMTET_40511 [Cymbomonas tetramitiformis]|uniref:Rubisco LSMT substrate-binding domain-containing protein n=1 Tax=Cymbomonas tetramitiformis TaxID=36881 RepID=A0AAE0CA02_9CHLO|nr:hypothetical protein CYMTET_40511 [Cymbomonas tetramitiformis]
MKTCFAKGTRVKKANPALLLDHASVVHLGVCRSVERTSRARKMRKAVSASLSATKEGSAQRTFEELLQKYAHVDEGMNVDIREGSQGRCLFWSAADRDIDSAALTLHVPSKYLLSVSLSPPWQYTPAASSYPPLQELLEDAKTPSAVKLAALLLWASSSQLMVKTSASDEVKEFRALWTAYRQYLPQLSEMTSIVCFTPGTPECAALQDEVLEKEVGSIVDGLRLWHTRYFEGTELEVLAPDPQTLLWALAILRTRSLKFPNPDASTIVPQEIMLLTPFIDMANHSAEGGALVNLLSSGLSLSVSGHSATPSSSSTDGPDQGATEATFVYGNFSNRDFMRSFGFVEDANVGEEMDLVVSTPDEQHVVEHLFDHTDAIVTSKGTTFTVLPHQEVVYRCSSSAEALAAWPAEFAGVTDTGFDPQVARAYAVRMAAAAAVLARQCTEQLHHFETTLAEDRALLEDSSVGMTALMEAAVRYRISRKCAIESAQHRIEEYKRDAEHAAQPDNYDK